MDLDQSCDFKNFRQPRRVVRPNIHQSHELRKKNFKAISFRNFFFFSTRSCFHRINYVCKSNVESQKGKKNACSKLSLTFVRFGN